MNIFKNQIFISIILAVIAGLSIERLSFFSPGIPYFIVFMLYFGFLSIKLNPRKLLRAESLITLCLSSAVMPVLAWHLFSRGQTHDYKIGMFLVAASPSGIIMLIVAKTLKSVDFELVLSNFILSHLALIFYLPLIFYLVPGKDVNLEIDKIFFQTATLVGLPWTFSFLSKTILPDFLIKRMNCHSAWINPILFFLVISSSLSLAKGQLQLEMNMAVIFFLVAAMYFMQALLAFIMGNVFSNEISRNSLVLSASSKNIQLTLGIAVLNFAPAASIPVVMGIVAHHISNIFWIWFVERKNIHNE